MEDPPLEPDGDAEHQPGSAAGTPRWVKLFGLIAVILALVLAAVLLDSGGDHGPGRHAVGGQTAHVGIAEERTTPDGGGLRAATPARGPVPA